MERFELLWLDKNKNYDKFNFAKILCEECDIVSKTAEKELRSALKINGEGGSIFLIRNAAIADEGYEIRVEGDSIIIGASTGKGHLYGAHSVLRQIAQGKALHEIAEKAVPSNPMRMLNHWDNSDGSIERGYSGNSFFFKDGEIIINERTEHYARLIVSVGINAVVINNVNVKKEATYFIKQPYLSELSQISEIFEKYGIKMYLSLNFAAAVEMGELQTADPLDKNVIDWWQSTCKEVFACIKNFGGFLVKADSEGRPGPFTYGRTHAEGANMLAQAVGPYGGVIIWRCFVYNCQQNWRDLKTDRARSAYDNFTPLDGKFLPNVILQIKNGPMDFQVREPVTPLFGGLKSTNQIIEFQITQEYTGQQRHVCYLMPMFKNVLDFKTYCKEQNDTVADIVSGNAFNQRHCGIAAVTNTGNDTNWTGHHLAAANLYGFARLAFNTQLSAEEIALEWMAQTYDLNAEQAKSVLDILMSSWQAYEAYTSPLGIGWMVNPNNHFGPNPDGYEYDRWGTYHKASHDAIGVDRTINGTGYATLYNQTNADMYANRETCPEELLLFFHRVEYTYKLKSGKTLIQHIYDTHFEGAEKAAKFVEIWKKLKNNLPQTQYKTVLERLEFQKNHSCEWRDIINSYFFRKTGIIDEKGRQLY